MGRVATLAVLFAAAAVPAAPAAAARSHHRPRARVRVVSHGDRIPRGADRRHGRMARMATSPVTSELADGWCGAIAPAADDVVDQAAAGNAIKVVYAHPADVPDHLAQYAPKIEAAVKAVQQAFLDATDGGRTLRFDVGTPCGANYLDIEDIALPRPASAYSADTYTPGTTELTMTTDLKLLVTGSPSCVAVSPSKCTRDFLVFADGVYKGDQITGVATRRTDPTPAASNASNSGGLFAYVLGDGSANFSISPDTTAEHEVMHNLGAVQSGALHYSGNGHCWDGNDVMCYDDGGSYFDHGTMTYPCFGFAASTIDCGHDDYFDPTGGVQDVYGNPTWNIYDSKFLCAAATCITGNIAPVAAFTPPAGARAGAPVTLDGSASTDEAAPVASYSWDANGDGVVDGTGPALSYTYAAPGTYTASLTVTDVGGARATATRSVTVAAPAPVVAPPAPAPVLVAKAKAESLSAVLAAAQSRLRRMGGLRALLRGRALKLSYTPAASGRLAVRIVLGRRTLARATKPATAGRAVVVTLRLSRATRRKLRHAHGTPRVRLAFTKR